jgi:branched-chain amino acid aminotransferase
MHRFLLHNGEIRDTSEPLISPGQTGYMNGWGVFSTIRVAGGALFAFERHYARMQRDAELLRVPMPFGAGELERVLLRLVAANNASEATLRIAIVRNRGGAFEGQGIRTDADLVAFTADLADWGTGVRLYYIENGRYAPSPFAGTKVTSWCQNLTWYEEAHERGFDEVILLNERRQVSECTSANIFAVVGNQVYTPPVTTSGCLPGVTRAILLEEISIPGLSIEERELTTAELETADQVFITSTTRNLLPVLEIECRAMRQSAEVFSKLRKAFEAYQIEYSASRLAAKEAVKI